MARRTRRSDRPLTAAAELENEEELEAANAVTEEPPPDMTKRRYRLLCGVMLNGKHYQPGEVLELTDAQADPIEENLKLLK